MTGNNASASVKPTGCTDAAGRNWCHRFSPFDASTSEPVTSACGDGDPQDDGTWKGCLNGNRTAQALAAEGYLRLPSESSQVKRIYYYDFDGQNPGWDSGLVNVNPPLLGSRGTGMPRSTWCVLYDYSRGAQPAALGG